MAALGDRNYRNIKQRRPMQESREREKQRQRFMEID